MKLRKGDNVYVIAGKHKKKTGIIKQIDKNKQRVIVENLYKIKKHVKPSNLHPDGGIVEKDGWVHLSNVMIIDEKAPKKNKKKFSKIGYKFINGEKKRFYKLSKKIIK